MASKFIRINSGAYRNFDISGTVFELVEGFKVTAKGSYVTVKNRGEFPGFPETIRVKVPGKSDIESVAKTELPAKVQSLVTKKSGKLLPEVVIEEENSTETDEEAIARIRERFQVLDEITEAAANGDIRATIVSGPPGVGKSFGIEKVLEKHCLFDQISGKRLRTEIIKGAAGALGIYTTLYKHSDPNNVVVFDDCDSVFFDDQSLNILKSALDSGRNRKISWLYDSNTLRNEGIPNSFLFHGSVIFITNLKFDALKSSRIKDHIEALQSRCHYLDLTLDTMRDKILRIRQIAQDSRLFGDMDIDVESETKIINFMDENKTRLREVSLRMAIKVAQLHKSFPAKWEKMAELTCMKPNR